MRDNFLAMRLTPQQRNIITQTTSEVAGPAARAHLFGSRVNDGQRGGDIDLLIELPDPGTDRYALSLKLGARLERALGGRRVDVLVAGPDTPPEPVLNSARAHAVAL